MEEGHPLEADLKYEVGDLLSEGGLSFVGEDHLLEVEYP